jgi:cyclopropane fatty-acyl-phospholipid synthase-like methyltransferase
MKNLFDKTYYEKGVTTGVSGYENYRWLPELTLPMCSAIIEYLQLNENDIILDYGCAKGYIVRAFRELGINAYGVDVSEYAISNADQTIKDFVSLINEKDQNFYEQNKFSWCISKDVFEHIPYEELNQVLISISKKCDNLFIIILLGKKGKYIIPEYENDITHIIRENKEWWENKIINSGFEISKSSYLVNGIKDNWNEYKEGNLFIVAKSLLSYK